MVNQKEKWLAEQNLNWRQKAPVLGINSNNTAGPPLPRLPAAIKPRMDSLQSQRKMEKKLKKQNDENKENGGNIAAFFTQISKTSNATLGPSPRGLSANIRTIRPQLDPLQNQSSQPAMVSVEDLEKQPQLTGSITSLPVDAKAAKRWNF